MFNLAIDSKLRGCDLTALKVDDVAMNGRVKSRAIVIQKKTGRPVQFEITEQTRDTVARWIDTAGFRHGGFLFPSRICAGRRIRTRQYARLVSRWISSLGLDPARYGTHSLRRTKPTLIFVGPETCARYSYFLATQSWIMSRVGLCPVVR
jgi:integrase